MRRKMRRRMRRRRRGNEGRSREVSKQDYKNGINFKNSSLVQLTRELCSEKLTDE